MKPEAMFISGIFNYCDRWCERCPFTARCRLYSMNSIALDDRFRVEPESAVADQGMQAVGAIIASTHAVVSRLAAEQGVTQEDLSSTRRQLQLEDACVAGDPLIRQAEEYAMEAIAWLNDFRMAGRASASVQYAMETLARLVILIPAKVDRAIRSVAVTIGESVSEDNARDAMGSMKVGLLAMDESVLAWEALSGVAVGDAGPIRVAALLRGVRRACEAAMPTARSFVRPGLDHHVQ